MPITDDQHAALRAHLVHDTEGYRRIYATFDRETRRTYTTLVMAGFVTAAEHRFSADTDQGDIIGFVADARTRYSDAGHGLDPAAAERLIRAVHNDDVPIEDIDAETLGRAQLVLLTALVDDEQFNGEELDAFIGKARAVADEWTS